MKTRLIIEYYTPSNEDRNKEYLECIERNIKSKVFDSITVFIESGSDLPDDIKSEVNAIYDVRKTFAELFDYCNTNFDGDTCVIANTDIIFNNTLDIAKQHKLKNTLLCLTRWDILPNGQERFFDNNHGAAYFSQDSWIFKAPLDVPEFDFYMGKPGCDNKIAFLANQKGILVRNPSRKIVTKHLHKSNFRTYTTSDRVGGPYVGVEPKSSIAEEPNFKLLKV